MALDPDSRHTSATSRSSSSPPNEASQVKMTDGCPEGYDGTCLRPLGLCELGGSCDVCWYRPDHPRFRSQS